MSVYLCVQTQDRYWATLQDTDYDRYMSMGIDLEQDYNWHRYTISLRIPDDLTTGNADALVDSSYIMLGFGVASSRVPVDIRKIKLEKGNRPTEWSASYDDIKASIATVESSTNKKIETLSDNLDNFITTTEERLTEFQGMFVTEEGVDMKFQTTINTIQQDINNITEPIIADTQQIYEYIKFENGDIELKTSDTNGISLLIQNDRISFKQYGSEVAYIASRKLYITEAEILATSEKQGRLTLGNFAFVPQKNGSLSFLKVT